MWKLNLIRKRQHPRLCSQRSDRRSHGLATRGFIKRSDDNQSAYEIGDKIRFEVTPKDFGRIAAQTAKQVILQRVREAERNIIYNEFSAYEKTFCKESLNAKTIVISM